VCRYLRKRGERRGRRRGEIRVESDSVFSFSSHSPIGRPDPTSLRKKEKREENYGCLYYLPSPAESDLKKGEKRGEKKNSRANHSMLYPARAKKKEGVAFSDLSLSSPNPAPKMSKRRRGKKRAGGRTKHKSSLGFKSESKATNQTRGGVRESSFFISSPQGKLPAGGGKGGKKGRRRGCLILFDLLLS